MALPWACQEPGGYSGQGEFVSSEPEQDPTLPSSAAPVRAGLGASSRKRVTGFPSSPKPQKAYTALFLSGASNVRSEVIFFSPFNSYVALAVC